MNTVVNSLTLGAEATGSSGWFKDLGLRAWRAMEETGRARAHRHLLDFANQCEFMQPELAKELRAAVRQGPLA